jgi:hypothetical protein
MQSPIYRSYTNSCALPSILQRAAHARGMRCQAQTAARAPLSSIVRTHARDRAFPHWPLPATHAGPGVSTSQLRGVLVQVSRWEGACRQSLGAMAFLAFASLAGVFAYAIVAVRLGFAGRRNGRLWSILSAAISICSWLFLAAYLVPGSLGRAPDSSLVSILEAPMDNSPRYSALYAASYMGISFGVLAALHRLIFARNARGAGAP